MTSVMPDADRALATHAHVDRLEALFARISWLGEAKRRVERLAYVVNQVEAQRKAFGAMAHATRGECR